MKKVLLMSLVLFVMNTLHAQLANTKWKGTMETNSKIPILFNYAADTVSVTSLEDSSNIETMSYQVKDNVITFKKIRGRSSCDNTAPGNYKFDIKDDTLTMVLVTDNCSDRFSVLNNSKCAKVK